MDNENKNLQDEMQEKVRQDVSEKIAEAAAELQEEIEEATVLAEETADDDVVAEEVVDGEEIAEESEEALDGEETDEAVEEAEEVVKPEPREVTLKLRSLVLSLIGTALAGALLLFFGLKIPAILDAMPEGKTVMQVNGVAITDLDMQYYIYAEAMDYFKENQGVAKEAAEYDWSQKVDGDKTAEEIVKERAIETATREGILIAALDQYDVEWDEKSVVSTTKAQVEQMVNSFGEELVTLNAKAQALSSIKQYRKKILQSQQIGEMEAALEETPDQFYPEDLSELSGLEATDGASVKHILIKTKSEATEATGAPAELTGLSEEEALTKATEIAARAKNGEDFDALVAEFNEDPGATEKGYTFGPGEMAKEFEEASFAMKIGDISDPVKTTYGYHIIKRIPGRFELLNSWKSQAKIKIKERAIKKMSVADIMKQVAEDAEAFTTLYAETQGQK